MSTRRSLRPVLLVTGLMGVLALLAVLQYRWIGQVSEAERLRMQGSLRVAADQFRQDFMREVLAVGTALQADGDSVRSADWDSVASVQTEWLTSAPASHLVSGVYLLLNGETPSVLKLDTAQSKYVPVPSPERLRGLLARLNFSFDEHRPGPPRNSAWVLESSGPYLLHALSSGPGRGGRGEGSPSERRLGLQLLMLNPDFLSGKLLPELAAHHFGGPAGFLYQSQVYLADQNRTVLYSSQGAQAKQSTPVDLDEELVEMRPWGGGGPDRGPRERFFGFGREGRGRPFGMQRGFGMPMLIAVGSTPWRLSVRHREGSVAAAAQAFRWRNLSISFAVLLVLGAGMVTIIRNTQKAQRLADLQMEFVAGVSHELRTPLAVITSAAENLTDGVVEGSGQVKQYGTLIRNESRRLSGMMEQILHFAAGQKQRHYKPVLLTVPELVEGALGLSQTLLTEGGFIVDLQIAPSLPAVRGESNALTQCLQNLISNAAKYSGESRWIGIRATAEKGWVTVTVADRGIGIESSDLPHLFDAFFRAKSVRSAQIHGTGLGLNLARSFARDAGGDLSVESTVGKGSVFTLRLPAEGSASAEAPRLVNQPA